LRSTIDDVARALKRASSVTVLTGSGVSAESGIPTFRDAQTGLWARYDPQELATPEAFRRDPALVWEWYAWRRDLIAGAMPNAGHEALTRMQGSLPSLALVTQNVDGLHQKAGGRDVIELHGNITRSRCSVEGTIVEPPSDDAGIPPRCAVCGAYLRPDVVWFGEALPLAAMEAASEAARGCDVFLSVGTSALVYPVAALPFEALDNGATVVEVNPEPTPLTSSAAFVLTAPAGAALSALERALRARE
jgi:NAD-dependent deacetylase